VKKLRTDGANGANGKNPAGAYTEDGLGFLSEQGNQIVGNKILGGTAEAAAVNAAGSSLTQETGS
jgi:hypothetical protein